MIGSANYFKGQLKFLILKSLSKEPMHGYLLMKNISENCMNLWKPTAGSLYPSLEELRSEGLIEVRKESKTGRKKKEYCLMAKGKERFEELEKQVSSLEQSFLEHCKDEKAKVEFEDVIYFTGLIRNTIKEELLKYRGTMLEFAMLYKQGKISKTQLLEFKKAVLKLLESVKKIGEKAKK